MQLLKYLLITVLIFWLIRRVMRIFSPNVSRQGGGYGSNRGGNYNSSNSNSANRSTNGDGSIRISKVPPKNPKDKHVSGGEYVDFEEVD